MTVWLRASNRAGLPVPMAYIIDQLAQRWHTTPWEIEEAPYAWREAGLAFMVTESEAQRWRSDHGRGADG